MIPGDYKNAIIFKKIFIEYVRLFFITMTENPGFLKPRMNVIRLLH
jgi:hypothetical protein